MLTVFRKAAALSRVAQAVQSTLDPYFNGVIAQVRGEGFSIVDDVGGVFTSTGTPRQTEAVSEVKVGSRALGFGFNDTLQINARPDFRMPYDFTVEFWMRPTAYPATGTESALVTRPQPSTYTPYGGFLQADGRFRAVWGSGTSGTTVGLAQIYSHPSGQKVPLNEWTHICQQRRNGQCELYVNGVLVGQGGYGQTDGNTTYPLILARNYEGYLDHIRVTNGVARYRGNFTPPVQDLYLQDGPDPYYDMVSLLLHMDGPNGGTEFKDEKGHAFTALAGAVTATVARPGFGNSAGDFRSNGYLLTNHAPDLNLGEDNFTIEGMFHLPTFGGATPLVTGRHYDIMQKGVIALSNFEFSLSLYGTDANNMQLCLRTSTNGTAIARTLYSQAMPIATVLTPGWHHFGIIRDGTVIRYFVDGVARATAIISTDRIFMGTGQLSIGANPMGADNYNIGYLDEIRLTKGLIRFTSAFGVPVRAYPTHPVKSTKLLLHAEGVQGGDSSEFSRQVVASVGFSTDAKFGTQSFQPNGGTTEQVYSINPLFQLGASDFTLEFFIKATQSVGTAPGAIIAMIDVVNTDGNNGGAIGGLAITPNGVHTSLDGATWATSSGNMPLGQGLFNTGQWVHMAVVRYGAKMMLFLDGVKQREVTIGLGAVFARNPGRFQLGSSNGVHGSYPCKIDEVRFSRRAVYTANFTVPTAPFTE